MEYEYDITEIVDPAVMREQIDESDMTDKSIDFISADEDTLKLKVAMTNTLDASDEAKLDTLTSGIVKQTWIRKRKDDIDLKTDNLIAYGFEWNDVKFCLDLEHQMSYKGSHDLRDELTYPYTIKGIGENYYHLANADEYHTFLLAAFVYIQTQIQTGWGIKDTLSSLTLQQLKDWTDPRG